MDFRNLLLIVTLVRSYASETACDTRKIGNSLLGVQQQLEETKRSTDDVISRLNDFKTSELQILSDLSSRVDSMKSHLFNVPMKTKNTKKVEMALRDHFKSLQQSMEQIKNEQFNIKSTGFHAMLQISQNYLKTNMQNIEELKNVIYETLDVGRNNSRKIDSLEKSNPMVRDNVLRMDRNRNDAKDAGIARKEHLKEIKEGPGKCPDWEDTVWRTDHLLWILIPMVILAMMLVGVNGCLVVIVLKQKVEKAPSYESIRTISSTLPTTTEANAPNGSDESENQRLLEFDNEDIRESYNSACGADEYSEPVATGYDPDIATKVKFRFSPGNQDVRPKFLSSGFANTDRRPELMRNIQESLRKGQEWQPNVFHEYDDPYEQENRPLSAPNAGRSILANKNFSAMGGVNRTSSDVILSRTGCNVQGAEPYCEHLKRTAHTYTERISRAEPQRDRSIGNAINDYLGATEDETQRYERLQRPTVEEECNYTGLVPPVFRDILREMPSGMTVEDIIRTSADDQLAENQSDDKDSGENSGYLEGRISSSREQQIDLLLNLD